MQYICQLSVEIQAMEGGDLDVPITFRGNHELTRLAHSLDSMRQAFQEQKEREINIFRANQAMIIAMSHDLRTPLTTLQIYTDILRYKKYEPSQLDGYLEKIDAKAAQIKQLSENIFEYSLVSGIKPLNWRHPAPFGMCFMTSFLKWQSILPNKISHSNWNWTGPISIFLFAYNTSSD